MSKTLDSTDAAIEEATDVVDPIEEEHREDEDAVEGQEDPSAELDAEVEPDTGDGPEPRSIVEAVLFAADAPLKPAKIAEVAEINGVKAIKAHIAELNEHYENTGAAFRIEKVAEGYQMLTLPVYNRWLSKLLRVRQENRLTQAALETLAIVAYKQPVLRADVEAIRGVACGEMLNRLRELNLIKIVGRAEDVGRPILYGTTKQFLEVFGLGGLEDLPEIESLKPPE